LLPLFNKFEPLPEGELKQAIARYSEQQKFDLAGVSVMDGSKRSSKSNAFFTGFGKFRKLALFDTLIAQQSVDEIVAVVAHEVGHFKCGHIPRMIGLQLVTTAILFWVMGTLMNDPRLFGAFGLNHIAVPTGLILVWMIYSPLMRFLSMIPHAFSRKHEFEADAFSVATYRNPGALRSALKKLSAENFAHLTPHPLKVFFDYTHPPTLERLRAIERIEGKAR
jgi:STE24 endopeptidase